MVIVRVRVNYSGHSSKNWGRGVSRLRCVQTPAPKNQPFSLLFAARVACFNTVSLLTNQSNLLM